MRAIKKKKKEKLLRIRGEVLCYKWTQTWRKKNVPGVIADVKMNGFSVDLHNNAIDSGLFPVYFMNSAILDSRQMKNKKGKPSAAAIFTSSLIDIRR